MANQSITLCKYCGKRIAYKTTQGKTYCSLQCVYLDRKAKAKYCLNCNTLFTPLKFHKNRGRYSSYNFGKLCSRSCQIAWISNNKTRKQKISDSQRGEKHHNWKGGISKHRLGARGPNWRQQRKKALTRDNHTCQCCGASDVKLVVHHIIPYHNFTDYKKANKLSNLKTLCISCHMSEEEYAMSQITLPLWHGSKQHAGVPMRGDRHYCAQASSKDVLMIRRLFDKDTPICKIHRNYFPHLSYSIVSNIATRRSWRSVPEENPNWKHQYDNRTTDGRGRIR